MKEKYQLNTSIYYYNPDGGYDLLANSEIASYDYELLKSKLDKLPGNYYKGEYEPETECIKCSAVIFSLANDDYESTMIEKYFIYILKDFVDKEFLNLFNSLEIKPT